MDAMGVGRLDIGMGAGGAQVFGSNLVIGQFAEILAQRKAKRDADNKFLNDQLATTYDPGALRNNADKSTYLDKYNKIKLAAIDAENEKNDKLKAMKISQVRQQLGDLAAWGEGSKKQAIIDRQLGTEFMKNPDHYEDDSVAKYKKGLDLNWDDPNVINNPSMVERRVDPEKLKQQYEKSRTQWLKSSPATYDNGTFKKEGTFFGKPYGTITQNRVVPIHGENAPYEQFLHQVSSDSNWIKGLRDMYPDIQGANQSQTNALRAAKYMQDQGDWGGIRDKPKERQVSGQFPDDRFYQHQNWLIQHGLKTTSNERTPAQINIAGDRDPVTGEKTKPGIVDNDQNAINKFISLIPKGQYGDKFDPNSVVKIDPSTGVQTWTFPEHMEIDTKNAKTYESRKKAYEADPKKTGYFWNKDRKVIPWEESDSYKELVASGTLPYKPAKNQPQNTYVIDPNSPNAASEIAKMGVEQKVNFKQLNDIEGKKSGRGQIKEAQAKPSQDKTYTVKGGGMKYTHKKLLQMGYTEEQIQEALKEGNLK